MPEEELIDTQKKEFFQECENYTFWQKAMMAFIAIFFWARRHFQTLKNRLWVA